MTLKKRSSIVIAVEGIAANLLFGTLFVWSILRNPLLELFPTWNEGMLSFIFGIHNLFTCAGILLGGYVSKRFSTRRVFLIFALMAFLGLSGFAFLPTQRPQLAYITAMLLFWFAATGVGIGINVVQSTTILWFPKNSGAISGALYMALGVSSVLLATVAQKLLPSIGTKNVLPIFGCTILVIALLILCDKRSITAPPELSTAGKNGVGLRPMEMLKMPAFWVLALWNICLRTSGLILLDHTASMAVAFGGAALAAMLIAPANGLGCLSVGIAMDKLGIRRMMCIDAVLMSIAALLLCIGTYLGHFPIIFVGLLLTGFSYGGSGSAYAASIKNRFGTKYYTQTFAVSNLVVGCAALLESTSGVVLDSSGSYFCVMLLVLLLAVIALILSFFAKRAKL